MTQVAKRHLWAFLCLGGRDQDYDTFSGEFEFHTEGDESEPVMSRETFDALKAADLAAIVADQDISENHIGGDDIVAVADDVLGAIATGYSVVTWYGPSNEALVVGYRPAQVQIVG